MACLVPDVAPEATCLSFASVWVAAAMAMVTVAVAPAAKAAWRASWMAAPMQKQMVELMVTSMEAPTAAPTVEVMVGAVRVAVEAWRVAAAAVSLILMLPSCLWWRCLVAAAVLPP